MTSKKPSPLKGKTRAQIQEEKAYREDRVLRFKKRLSTSELAACAGLMRLWEEQTPEEKAAMADIGVSNGVGFSPYDTEYLSMLARKVEDAGGYESGGMEALNAEQRMDLTQMIPKYSRQLLKLTDRDKEADGEAPANGGG